MTDDDRMLGELPPAAIAEYLREIGDPKGAERFEKAAAQPQGQGFAASFLGKDQYAYTGMVVGFIARDAGGPSGIVDANAIDADPDLKNRRIKVTLDQFHVQSYPGNGKHRILCEFAGQNQLIDEAEELKFALTLEANDGEGAGVSGKPIFMGLTVGDDGLNFRGQTVHVRSSTDDLVLEALNGEAFKNGLSLMTTMQPALKPFVSLATGVVKAAIKRRGNQRVYKFDIGLDFNKNNLSARLRRGSYVVVQTRDEDWVWSNFEFVSATRTIKRKSDGGPLELNYFVIGIDDFIGEVPTKVEAGAHRSPAGSGRKA